MRCFAQKAPSSKSWKFHRCDLTRLFEGLSIAQSKATLVFRRYDRLAFQFPVSLQIRIIPRQCAFLFQNLVVLESRLRSTGFST